MVHYFLNLKLAKNPFLSAMGCHTWPRKFKFKKVHQTVFTICRGLSHLTGWAALLHGIFSRVEKPSEDINIHLFLINKKGLRKKDWHLIHLLQGLAAEFCSKIIPRNRLGTAYVIPRKKVLIPRHSEVYKRVSTEARNGRKLHEKN